MRAHVNACIPAITPCVQLYTQAFRCVRVRTAVNACVTACVRLPNSFYACERLFNHDYVFLRLFTLALRSLRVRNRYYAHLNSAIVQNMRALPYVRTRTAVYVCVTACVRLCTQVYACIPVFTFVNDYLRVRSGVYASVTRFTRVFACVRTRFIRVIYTTVYERVTIYSFV